MYYLSVEDYLDEKGITATVGPYGLNTREKQHGCKVKITNIYPKMWEEVVKPFFKAEAKKKEMVFEYGEEADHDPGFLSIVLWVRTANIEALGGPRKGVLSERG